jgi:hypothetical protein
VWGRTSLWLWFASSWRLMMVSLFICWLAMCYFLWVNVDSGPLYFIFMVFCCWVLGVLYTFRILTPVQICDLQMFLHSPSLLFHYVDSVLWCTVFNFHEVWFVYFPFIDCAFWCHIQQIIIKSSIIKLFSYFFPRGFLRIF